MESTIKKLIRIKRRKLSDKYNIDESFLRKNPNGTYTYLKDINLRGVHCENLLEFKKLKISKVIGDFICASKRLTSLDGCPRNVKNIDVSNNQLETLETLEGGPKFVTDTYDFSSNKVKNMKGMPKTLEHINAKHNRIENLKGLPIPRKYNSELDLTGNCLRSVVGYRKNASDSFTIVAFDQDVENYYEVINSSYREAAQKSTDHGRIYNIPIIYIDGRNAGYDFGLLASEKKMG